MPVTFNPLISKSGFKSQGFDVDTQGNLTANSVLANSIDAALIKLNGVTLFGAGPTNVFEITGDFTVSEGSTPYLSIVNGQIIIENRFDSVGKIDNVDIGTVVPAAGNFTNVVTPSLEESTSISFIINNNTVGEINSDGITVPVVDTSVDNTAIGVTTPSTGAFTSVSINNQPTAPSSATRKDYVDNQISAFAIAFGL